MLCSAAVDVISAIVKRLDQERMAVRMSLQIDSAAKRFKSVSPFSEMWPSLPFLGARPLFWKNWPKAAKC